MARLRETNPALAERVHYFNSYFYKKISSKKDAAAAHALVAKWTAKVDLFSKEFIIVPINEQCVLAP